jgi:hypothetical protein
VVTDYITADPSQSTASASPDYALLSDHSDVAVDTRYQSIAWRVQRHQSLLDMALESAALTMLSESSFAEEWDSPEDAIYDALS